MVRFICEMVAGIRPVGAVLAPPFCDVTEPVKGTASSAPTMPDTDLFPAVGNPTPASSITR